MDKYHFYFYGHSVCFLCSGSLQPVLESTFNSSYWSGYSGYSIPPMVDPYYDYPPSYYYPQVDTI